MHHERQKICGHGWQLKIFNLLAEHKMWNFMAYGKGHKEWDEDVIIEAKDTRAGWRNQIQTLKVSRFNLLHFVFKSQ